MVYVAEVQHGISPNTTLSLHRFLLRAANAAANAFLWALLDRYFVSGGLSENGSLLRTIYLYALVQVTVMLLVPLTARFLRFGARRNMLYGSAAQAAAYIVLGIWVFGTSSAQDPFIALFAILLGFSQALYRAPYALEHARTKNPTRVWLEPLLALAPLAAGFALDRGDTVPSFMLLILALVVLVSALPLKLLPEVYDSYTWGYRQTFAHLFDWRFRPAVISSFWNGMEGTALFLFWPIFIFLLAGQSYAVVGVVLCGSLIAAFVLRLLLRRHSMSTSSTRLFLLSASGWVFRVFTPTPFVVFLADSYHFGFAKPSVDITGRTLSSDNTSYVDEVTVLKELGAGVGSVALCAIGAFLCLTEPIAISFIVVFCIVAFAAGAFAVAAANERTLGA